MLDTNNMKPVGISASAMTKSQETDWPCCLIHEKTEQNDLPILCTRKHQFSFIVQWEQQSNNLREITENSLWPTQLVAWNFHRKGEIRQNRVFSLNWGDKISDFKETKATKSYEVTHRRGSCKDIETQRYANNALNFFAWALIQAWMWWKYWRLEKERSESGKKNHILTSHRPGNSLVFHCPKCKDFQIY